MRGAGAARRNSALPKLRRLVVPQGTGEEADHQNRVVPDGFGFCSLESHFEQVREEECLFPPRWKCWETVGKAAVFPSADRDVSAWQMFIAVGPSLCLQQSCVIVQRVSLLGWCFMMPLTTYQLVVVIAVVGNFSLFG